MLLFLVIIEAVVLLVLAAILRFTLLKKKTEHKLNLEIEHERESLQTQKFKIADASVRLLELKEALEMEREKSDKLLHNILPDRVIHDLSEKGKSTPERFENVTIYFSDLVNFTESSSKLDPTEVIMELSEIFGEFDRIFVRNHCERIKTIGDAYMAVSGLPVPNAEHWKNILNAAREAVRYLNERNQKPGAHIWRMRVGIHSGSVVGGIVGSEKYIYDIFGDAVNMAARMEQNSEAMHINVSESTRDLAAQEFKFTDRGLHAVKGKGEMRMFFLDDVLPEPAPVQP